MHRFFIAPKAFQGGKVTFPEHSAQQIRSVLRMRPGDRVVVLDNSGWEFEVELLSVTRKEVLGKLDERRRAGTEPPVELVLFQSLLKKDNFEWVLQKCTELGVMRFVPILSQYTVIDTPSSSRLERWRRIIVEAAEQSRRGRLPILETPITFNEAAMQLNDFDLALIPWELEAHTNLRGIREANPKWSQAQRIACLIGPEGGFTSDEIALARAHAALPVSLGPRILRSETAAIVASTLILSEYGALSLEDSD